MEHLNTYSVAVRIKGEKPQIWHIASKDYEAARQSALKDIEGCKAAIVLVQPLEEGNVEVDPAQPPDAA